MNIRMVVPVQVGVVALLAGGFFFYLTLRGTPDEPAATPQVESTRLVSREGGFSIGVPEGLTASRHGKTVRLTSKDKSLVVTAGPVGTGSLTQNSDQFVKSLEAGYSGVRVLGREPQRVNGRSALATFGQAINAKKVKIRFVSVVVSARPRDYSINTFTALDTDPDVILPKANAVVDTFEILLATTS